MGYTTKYTRDTKTKRQPSPPWLVELVTVPMYDGAFVPTKTSNNTHGYAHNSSIDPLRADNKFESGFENSRLYSTYILAEGRPYRAHLSIRESDASSSDINLYSGEGGTARLLRKRFGTLSKLAREISRVIIFRIYLDEAEP